MTSLKVRLGHKFSNWNLNPSKVTTDITANEHETVFQHGNSLWASCITMSKNKYFFAEDFSIPNFNDIVVGVDTYSLDFATSIPFSDNMSKALALVWI